MSGGYVFQSPKYLAREIEIGLGDGKYTTTLTEAIQSILLGLLAYVAPAAILQMSTTASAIVCLFFGLGWFLGGMFLRRLYGPAYMFEIKMRFGMAGGAGIWDRRGRTRCTWARVRRPSPFRGPAPLAPVWPQQRWAGPLGMGVHPPTPAGSFVAGASLVKHLERKL